MSFSLHTIATDTTLAACIVEPSAVSDAQQLTVSSDEQERIALDEGVDYFSAQGALDAWRLANGR